MVRKFVVSVLVLLYSASAIGLPLHFHYCGGELKHVTLFVKMSCHEPEQEQDPHACCKNKAAQCHAGLTMNSCCDDATEWIQDNVPAVQARALDLVLYPISYAVAIPVLNSLHSEMEPGVYSDDADPPPGLPFYLLACALIYYG